MTVWNETLPTMASLVSEFPSTLTNQMEAFRQGVEQTFYWTQSSGASAGEPILSSASTTPGAARAFFAPASSVSSSKDGRLFLASDTTTLYAVPSGGSVRLFNNRTILGDSLLAQAVVFGLPSFESIKPNSAWLVQSGTSGQFASTATIKLTFPIAYAAAPRVMLCPIVSSATNSGVLLSLTSITGSSMSVRPAQVGPVTSWGFMWRSAGTVAVS